MSGFSISSPDLDDLVGRMAALDPSEVYRTAAHKVGSDFLEPVVGAAAKQAGASEELMGDLGTYIGEDGEVYVGVPGGAGSHAEAVALEYGTLDQPPADFLGGTAAGRTKILHSQFYVQLNAELRRGLGYRMSR
jgi:hypothetical protein